MKENRVEKILGTSFLAIGILLMVIAMILAIFTRNFQNSSKRVTGVITEIYSDSICVAYTYEGTPTETYLSEYSTGMRTGDSIELYVSKDNPSHVRTKMLLYLPCYILCIVGLPFIIIGAFFFVFVLRKKRSKENLLQNGRIIEAVVTGGQMNYNMTVNGRHPWKLECKYEDAYTGETFLYSSYHIWNDPSLYIGQTVRVYVDRNNPRRYYVCVDDLENEKNGGRVFDYR